MTIRLYMIVFCCFSWIGASAQMEETMLFAPCPSFVALPDSLRAACHVRIYDACWVESLHHFTSLKRLDARQTQLVGAFPPNTLDSVCELILQNNDISQINCRNLPQVKELDVAGNPLDEFSLVAICDSLPHLEILRIGGSKISNLQLPKNKSLKCLDMCCETRLERVYGGRAEMRIENLLLSGCELTGDELDIRDCQVDSLDLSFNQIALLHVDGLPRTLAYLDLSYNPFRGFNGGLAQLRRLKALDMRGCEMKAMPVELSKLNSLSKLFVDVGDITNEANELTMQALPPKLEALWIHLESGREPPTLPRFKVFRHLKEMIFEGNVPADLSAFNSLGHLQVIRLEGCEREAIGRALQTLDRDKQLVVWVPSAMQRQDLQQKYPHWDIRPLK